MMINHFDSTIHLDLKSPPIQPRHVKSKSAYDGILQLPEEIPIHRHRAHHGSISSREQRSSKQLRQPIKKTEANKSMKNLNLIPIAKKTQNQGKKPLERSSSAVVVVPSPSSSSIESYINANLSDSSNQKAKSAPVMPNEIQGFSLDDEMKMLNNVFKEQMKKMNIFGNGSKGSSKVKCAICKNEIESSSEFVYFGGNFYHLGCERCHVCKRKVEPPFYIERNAKILCEKCKRMA